MLTVRLALFLAAPLVAGCARRVTPESIPAEPTLETRAALLAIAEEYPAWDRVDDNVRWAPEACRLDPGAGRLSRSTGAHGGKLYYLYARDRAAYVDPARGQAPVGQTIVKEAFEPVALGPDEEPDVLGLDAAGRPLAERDGARYRAGRPTGLFVLHKTGSDDSDAGWIYATLSADSGSGSEPSLLAAGRLTDCMACHARGTIDRQFGLGAR